MPLETTSMIELSASIHTLVMFSALPKPLLRQYFLAIAMVQNAGLLSGTIFSGTWVTSGRVCHQKKSLVVVVDVPFYQSKNSKAKLSSNAWL